MESEGVHAALASPVRRAMLAMLRNTAADGDTATDAVTSLTAAELARDLSLHVTTARFHLEQLERAGLVVRTSEPTHRRGRPAAGYRAVDADLTAAREQMIDALAEAAAGTGTPEENANAAGRRWADAVPCPAGDPRAAVTDVLRRLGFDPEPTADRIRLRACPFRHAARRTPQVVCQVHLGLAQGLAARASADALHELHVGLIPFVEPEICHITMTTSP